MPRWRIAFTNGSNDPDAEHQHLCLDATLHQRRQQLEEMALRARDAAGYLLDMQNTDSRCPSCGRTPTVTLARPSWPGSPKARMKS